MQELQEFHSALEEAKADIVGLWALRFLISQVRYYTFSLVNISSRFLSHPLAF